MQWYFLGFSASDNPAGSLAGGGVVNTIAEWDVPWLGQSWVFDFNNAVVQQTQNNQFQEGVGSF